MQRGRGNKARQQIIQHDAKAARHLFIDQPDRPGLDDIQHSENDETREYPLPTRRDQTHARQISHDLVPDDRTMVMATQTLAGVVTDADTRQKQDRDHGQILCRRQCAQWHIQRNTCQCPQRTWGHRRQTTTKSKRKAMHRMQQQPDGYFLFRFLVIHMPTNVSYR